MTDLNKDIASGTIVSGITYDAAIVNGKLVLTVTAGPAELMAILLAKINNPTITAAVGFGEAAIGLT